jgi:hypothetical protein
MVEKQHELSTVLPETVPDSADVLAEQHGAELLKAGGRASVTLLGAGGAAAVSSDGSGPPLPRRS